jgi:spermidine/putrescine transport system substrate-binding protein
VKTYATALASVCIAAFAAFLFSSSGLADPAVQLAIFTWADYIDPELVAEFERENAVKVQFSYYASDDDRDEILATSHALDYDLVVISGLMIQPYVTRGWLAPISRESVPNLRHIEPRWRGAFPKSEEYGVPYFWGTLGIGYRKDLVPEGFSSWKEFYQPRESLRGRIAVLRSSRDVVGMALKALGHSANTADRDAIREAGRLLEAQKPFVRSYGYVSVDEQSALVTGEVFAGMLYSGDVISLREYHPDVDYVVPVEGSNIWCDYLAVFQSSKRKELAARFIDFLNRPEIAARNARFLNYATPNRAALARLPAKYLHDNIIHPGREVLSRSESYRPLPPRAQKEVNAIFARILN